MVQPFCRRARYTRWRRRDQGKGRTVFSCDYNGWADVPEEEREAIDAFEASRGRPRATPALLPASTLLRLPSGIPDRKAA